MRATQPPTLRSSTKITLRSNSPCGPFCTRASLSRAWLRARLGRCQLRVAFTIRARAGLDRPHPRPCARLGRSRRGPYLLHEAATPQSAPRSLSARVGHVYGPAHPTPHATCLSFGLESTSECIHGTPDISRAAETIFKSCTRSGRSAVARPAWCPRGSCQWCSPTSSAHP